MAPSKQDTASVADDVSMADAAAPAVQETAISSDPAERRIRIVSSTYSRLGRVHSVLI